MTQSGYLVPSPRTESGFLNEKENSELLGFRTLSIVRSVSIPTCLENRTMDRVREYHRQNALESTRKRIVNYSYPVSSFPFLSFLRRPFLSDFPYFENIKGGLWAHLSVCVCICLFVYPLQIFMIMRLMTSCRMCVCVHSPNFSDFWGL
jgi:hypothetical protein